MQAAIYGLEGCGSLAKSATSSATPIPAGYILFRRNCENPRPDAAADRRPARTRRPRDLPILIDQEGGRVARMKPPEWPAFPLRRGVRQLYQAAPSCAIEAVALERARAGADAQRGRRQRRLPAAARRPPAGRDGHRRRPRAGQRADAGRRARPRDSRRLHSAGVLGVIKHIPGPWPRPGRQPSRSCRWSTAARKSSSRPRAVRAAPPRADGDDRARPVYKQWDPSRRRRSRRSSSTTSSVSGSASTAS